MSNKKWKTGDYDSKQPGHSPVRVLGSAVSDQSTFSLLTSKSHLSGLSLLPLEDLKHHYNKYTENVKLLNVENFLLEKYLMRVRPNAYNDLRSSMGAADEMTKRVQRLTQKINLSTGEALSDSAVSDYSTDRRKTLTSSPSTGTRSTIRATQTSSMFTSKLSMAFRSDLISHEMENIEMRMQEFQKQCKITKFRLQAETEERIIAKKKLKSTRDTLQEHFNKSEAVSGHPISAEKYLKYMHDLLNATDQETGKIKLKVSTLNRLYSHLKIKMLHAMELGDTIYPIDFDELKIENKDFALDLENKNKNLLDLKRLTGFCTINLNVKKRSLDDLKASIDGYNGQIKSKENLFNKYTSEILKTVTEIDKAQHNNDSIKYVVENYTAPSVLDYAKVKLDLRNLQKDLKIWSRRVRLQNVTIKLLTQRLKNKSDSVYHFYKSQSDEKMNKPLLNKDYVCTDQLPEDNNSK